MFEKFGSPQSGQPEEELEVLVGKQFVFVTNGKILIDELEHDLLLLAD